MTGFETALTPSAVMTWDVMCGTRGVPGWAMDAAMVAWRRAVGTTHAPPQVVHAILLLAQADADAGGSPDDCLTAVLKTAHAILEAELAAACGPRDAKTAFINI